MASVLERLGQGLVSFGSGIPQSEIERIRANRDIAQNEAALGRQEIEANDVAVARNEEIRQLIRRVQVGDQEAAARLFELSPDLSDRVFESLGVREQADRERVARRAFEIANTPPEQQDAVIQRQIEEGRAAGRDMSDSESLLAMTPEERAPVLSIMQALPLTAQQRAGAGKTAQQRNFESLIQAATGPDAEGPDGDRRRAARIELGLEPRAATSAQERIADDPALTGRVAESGARIAGAKTEAEIQAELRSAEAVGAAEARKAALVEAAVQGERITAGRIKTADEARALLPEARAGAEDTIRLLNEIRNDPNLPDILGAVEGRIDFRLDENESALLAKINQVTGQTFLQAYQTLKGGGPITDREGQAATEAQSRLTNRAVSLSSYQAAIDELIGITNARLQRLSQKAKTDQPRVRTFNPETGQLE